MIATVAAGGSLGKTIGVMSRLMGTQGGVEDRPHPKEKDYIKATIEATSLLRRIAGKPLGIAGISLSVSAFLRQSQIFTSLTGSMFQLGGFAVDILLAPFIPIAIRFMTWITTNILPGLRQFVLDPKGFLANTWLDMRHKMGMPKLSEDATPMEKYLHDRYKHHVMLANIAGKVAGFAINTVAGGDVTGAVKSGADRTVAWLMKIFDQGEPTQFAGIGDDVMAGEASYRNYSTPLPNAASYGMGDDTMRGDAYSASLLQAPTYGGMGDEAGLALAGQAAYASEQQMLKEMDATMVAFLGSRAQKNMVGFMYDDGF
tara:strand:- start:1763 stop:2707 length:945 start_codon:yes stop_codon:yes gene_type:complete